MVAPLTGQPIGVAPPTMLQGGGIAQPPFQFPGQLQSPFQFQGPLQSPDAGIQVPVDFSQAGGSSLITNLARDFIANNPSPRTNVATPPPSNIQTSLANVALGGTNAQFQDIESIDDLISTRSPAALDILRQGSSEAIRLSQLAQRAGTQPLDQFADLQAFNEQQAILGTQGAGAQQTAIGNIPVSDFDRELQRRQTITQRRQFATAGERGSGAALLGAQQLAGAQQADIIQQRLQSLQPLVDVSRGVRSTQSGIDEASRLRQADLQGQLGTQEAAIRFGTAAPLIESRLNEAELSGLRGINAAQQRGQIAQQLANVAGQFVPQQTQVPQTQQIQTPFPEAGPIGVA